MQMSLHSCMFLVLVVGVSQAFSPAFSSRQLLLRSGFSYGLCTAQNCNALHTVRRSFTTRVSYVRFQWDYMEEIDTKIFSVQQRFKRTVKPTSLDRLKMISPFSGDGVGVIVVMVALFAINWSFVKAVEVKLDNFVEKVDLLVKKVDLLDRTTIKKFW